MTREDQQQKGTTMAMNSDQAKGRIKEAVGALADDDKLKKEGKTDQAVGDAKKLVNDVADKAEELVDKLKGTSHKE